MITDEEADKFYARIEDELKPHLTPEFLATLVLAVETLGWSVDAIETSSFAEELHRLAGLPKPTIVIKNPPGYCSPS